MTNEAAQTFIDNMQYSDYPVGFQGKCYWCLGVTWWEKEGIFSIRVFECENELGPVIRTVFDYESTLSDE